MKDPYEILDAEAIKRMKQMAESLSERDRRAFAATQADKIGWGGVRAISRLLGMSTETIKRGRDDLDSPERLPAGDRQRHVGAGRKGICFEQEGLEAAFDALVKTHLAGDPMNGDVVWTDLQPSGMVTALAQQGFSISENTVRALLKKRHSQAQARQDRRDRSGGSRPPQRTVREHRDGPRDV